MNKYFLMANIMFSLCAFSVTAEETNSPTDTEIFESMNEPGAIMFTPPKDWRYADTTQLGKAVKIMVVGKGSAHFPPSINLATETYQGTLKDYLKIMKAINDKEGAAWKDLGTIKTSAGNGSLSQVDLKNQWGEVREMHVVIKKKNTIYILTSAALREDFAKHYKDFFDAMRSLKINKEFEEMVSSPSLREELLKKIAALKIAAQGTSFTSEEFQTNEWIPFEKFLNERFSSQGKKWINYVKDRTKSEITN
jgi:hypothetical protein